MLPGSALNVKTKREFRKTNANVAQHRLIECRIDRPTFLAVVVRFHIKPNTKHNPANET